MYHLTVAAGGGTGNVGTEYEQIIAKVMECNGDSSMFINSRIYNLVTIDTFKQNEYKKNLSLHEIYVNIKIFIIHKK